MTDTTTAVVRVSSGVRVVLDLHDRVMVFDDPLDKGSMRNVAVDPSVDTVSQLFSDLAVAANLAAQRLEVLPDGRQVRPGNVDIYRIAFNSPLDVVLISSAAATLYGFLVLLRDWGAQRRVGRANALIVESEAAIHAALAERIRTMAVQEGLDDVLRRALTPVQPPEPKKGNPPGNSDTRALLRLSERIRFVVPVIVEDDGGVTELPPDDGNN